MLTLQVLIASTRPGRQGAAVGAWAMAQAKSFGKFDAELVDLAEVNLPLLDEPRHPRFAQYEHEHTKRWSAIVSRADAFVFVVPEYDHGPPASLINALQYLQREWAYKAVGFVSYGGVSGGTRAVNGLKITVVALKMMPIFEAVSIPFFTQFVDQETESFDPGELQSKAASAMLEELHRWASAIKPLRAPEG
jgi:NAD(P)H-dependent FMN reductase